MKRSGLVILAAGFLALGACAPGEVAVVAEDDVQDPEAGGMVTRPVTDLEIFLLPYDRDEVFDSLERAASAPEPPIPPALLEARDMVAEAQRDWASKQARWGVLRDTVAKLAEALKELDRRQGQYKVLYDDYQDFQEQLDILDGQVGQAFAKFDNLQRGVIEQSNAVKARQDLWAQEAFREVPAVIEAKIEASGREALADTTDAQGMVTVAKVKPGTWWVHARMEYAYTELYWNVEIEVVGGEVFQLRLTRANATERPNL